jgi:hypothetical protein
MADSHRAGGELGGGGRWWSLKVGAGDLCDDGRRWAAAGAVARMGGAQESEEEMRGRRERGVGLGGRPMWCAGPRGELGLVEERSSI